MRILNANASLSATLLGGRIPLLACLEQRIEVLYANHDGSVWGREAFDQWALEQECEDGFTLRCSRLLQPVHAEVTLRAEYTVRGHLVEQKITCLQRCAASLYIGLSQELTLPGAAQVWSFDAVKHEDTCIYGSWSRQAFPACGMLMPGGEVFGVLMDTGVANEWSRWHMRRTADGNAPAVTAYDPLLMEALPHQQGIRLRAGQYFPTADIPLEEDGPAGRRALIRRNYAYVFEFNCLQAPCSIQVALGDRPLLTHTVQETGRQILTIPAQDSSGLLSIRWEDDQAMEPLRLFERKTELRPWHLLEEGREKIYRYFFFVDTFPPTLRNLRLRSQLYLAEALGFEGTAAEKILYADFRMLNWQAEPGLRLPLCVPSIDYFEMYFRDIFWSANGVEDEWLNRTLLGMVERTMDSRCWVDNIITPYFGSIEKVDNEINYLYILWSCLNLKRFGHQPDMKKIAGVTALVMDRYDPHRTGQVLTNNPQSLMDVMWQDRPCRFAVSQGYYALTMKAALALGVPGVDRAYVEKAQAEYRRYYRPGKNGRSFLQTFPENGLGENGEDLDIISCLDLEPEFLSLYIFGESLLGKEIVLDTLEQIPVYHDCLMPIMAMTDGQFFTRERNPFNGGLYWEGGRYANGGSYLRPQYIVLAAGKYHGWEKADRLMAQRLKAEFETCPDAPVSIEYLHALGDPGKSSPHKVFAWNVFVNQINRWIRTTIDPDFHAGDDIL